MDEVRKISRSPELFECQDFELLAVLEILIEDHVKYVVESIALSTTAPSYISKVARQLSVLWYNECTRAEKFEDIHHTRKRSYGLVMIFNITLHGHTAEVSYFLSHSRSLQ